MAVNIHLLRYWRGNWKTNSIWISIIFHRLHITLSTTLLSQNESMPTEIHHHFVSKDRPIEIVIFYFFPLFLLHKQQLSATIAGGATFLFLRVFFSEFVYKQLISWNINKVFLPFWYPHFSWIFSPFVKLFATCDLLRVGCRELWNVNSMVGQKSNTYCSYKRNENIDRRSDKTQKET